MSYISHNISFLMYLMSTTTFWTLVIWLSCVLYHKAYGQVFRARLIETGETVALKKISKQYTDSSSFNRETDALLRVFENGGHPNISGLRDMYEDFGHYYLVLDLARG